jgi:hypothetical protein
MAGELFINGRLVDINQDAPFPLTFNISDIKDLTARKGNKSKTITLPGTKSNTSLMLSVYTLSATETISGTDSDFIDFDPSIKAECQYYQNGLLEFNGVAQLMSCKLMDGVWSFDITLVSDTIDYISRLAKIKVNELGWSEYNHALTYDNQQDTWNGTIQLNGSPSSNQDSQGWTGKGYYYGLIDYGFTRPSASTFGVEHIPPQVFCYEVLEKAFNYAGITWDSQFIDSQRFKRLLMAYPGGDLPTITQAQAEGESVFTTQDNTTTSSGYFLSNGFGGSGVTYFASQPDIIGISDYEILSHYAATINQDDLNQAQEFSPLRIVVASQGLYQINYAGDHDLDITISGDGSGAYTINGEYEVIILTYKNNILMSNDLLYSGSITSTTTSLTFSFDYSRMLNVNYNDEVHFDVRFRLVSCTVQRTALTNLNLLINILSNTSDLNFLKQQQALSAGGTVYLDSFLPDMTCDQFFKGLVTAFNLYIKPSISDPSILEIEPLSEFYNASGDAIDWTYKLDRSKDITVTPTINFSSKNYKFNFEQDDDYWNTRYLDDVQEQYGSFLIESQSQFAINDTEFKLPFSQKLLCRIPEDSPEGSFTDLIVPRSFQVKFNEDGSSLVEKKKGKPFIVQLGGLRTGAWIHRDEDGIDHSETDYPYVGHLDSLDSPTFDFNFGIPDYVFWSTSNYPTNNLYLYHEKFIKELISRFGKQITCSVMLRPSDINSLDFRNLINIDGVVYRLQKISDYQSGKNVSTNIELIRIIEGEGIQTTIVTPPYDPFTQYGRILEGETRGTDDRITEDGTLRIIEI